MIPSIIDWTDPMEVGRLLARTALLEDRAMEDAASGALGPSGELPVTCMVNAREEMVVAGVPMASLVFEELPWDTAVVPLVAEGERVAPGTDIARIQGSASAVLRGERVFLNILGRMCGIATITSLYVDICRGTGVEVLDTRKTTPGMRALEKYAVRTGGGINHRYSLADMAMLKDNHLAIAGGVESLRPVMERLRDSGVPVEIEVDTLAQLEVVLPLGPDRILLDNMSLEELRRAVEISRGTGIYLEASGGIDSTTVGAVAKTGVQGISAGALTHSVRCADIGLDWVRHGR